MSVEVYRPCKLSLAKNVLSKKKNADIEVVGASCEQILYVYVVIRFFHQVVNYHKLSLVRRDREFVVVWKPLYELNMFDFIKSLLPAAVTIYL